MEDFDFSKLENYVENGSVLPSPDQYVGELKVFGKQLDFTFKGRDSINYTDEGYNFISNSKYHEKNILVVLESPHRFEYDNFKLPIGLAMGKTGENFLKLFTKALSNSELRVKDGYYNVILSNAIQYQTSCGLNPINRKLRDKNWIDIYKNYGGEIDFKKRVYSLKPRYTINLCTGGRNPEGLRSIVSNSLEKFKLIKYKHFTEGNHPASWDVHGNTRNAIIY
jgi:hypothetical protein